MNDLKSILEPFKKRSRYHRNEALDAQHDGDFEQAEQDFTAARAAINDAIKCLVDLGVPDPESTERASEAECLIAAQLADCWGILGGVYRAQGDNYLEDAKKAYDEGNKYESSPRFNILNSYNRVNRLVVRVLKDPNLLSEPQPVVNDIEGPDKKTMRELFSETDAAIEQQLVAGRSDRPWALADLAMVRLLGELPNVDIALKDLDESTSNDPFPCESMLKVLRELIARNLPMNDKLISAGERLRTKLPPMLQGEPLASHSMTA